ncbi:MAG: hypothetical protein Q7K65_02605 [Candidatus Buchananbacteria bacterium]|nr:hypothetical protein [Candidatus Buchananbacteria bacterium]
MVSKESDKIVLGFSTGCLHKSGLSEVERLNFLRSIGCRVVELGCVKLKDFFSGELMSLKANDLRGFDYVSFHAPVSDYGFNECTREIFRGIRNLNRARTLDLVVFHPDTVYDFAAFYMKSVDFNFAFENMDKRKASHKSVKDMAKLAFQFQYPLDNFKMVLDVNYAYTNDPTMTLAAEFYEKLGDKIAQVHLSGYAGRHEPLFQTRQSEIIKSIRNLNVPIIVESILQPEELVLERDYILEVLREV